jgi:hypothetical protein
MLEARKEVYLPDVAPPIPTKEVMNMVILFLAK